MPTQISYDKLSEVADDLHYAAQELLDLIEPLDDCFNFTIRDAIDELKRQMVNLKRISNA